MNSGTLDSSLKDSSLLIRMVFPALSSLGLDVERIFERCGIDPELLDDHQARTPHIAQRLFWQVLEEESGDALIGLRLAKHVPVYHGQVLSYLFLSSPSFGEALRRTLKYRRLITDALDFEMIESHPSSELQIRYAVPVDETLRHRDECFNHYFARYFSVLTEGEFVCQCLNFTHAPAADIADYEALVGCELAFEQPQLGLVFDSGVLNRRSTHSEPELLAMHEQLAQDRLARLEKTDIVDRVRAVLAADLAAGQQPELSEVSQRLELSPRALRSHLSDVGTSFNEVLAQYRFGLARHLLARTEEPIANVVHLTGFSEPSTFYRAFKRWSGMTPAAYRELKWAQAAEKA